jgi:hypothetical protein
MNQLTKLLVGELLENKQVIGLYGGGFKPPTKGHFEVVEQALKEYPELDKLIIYVGGSVRDGITQEQSLAVWDIYKDLLGDKVEIQPSPSPIGDIIRYGRDNADKIVYFFLGEREGKESDAADTAQRTKNVEAKYPNTQIKIIKSPDTGISGTAARKILLNPEKTFEDFKQFLPDGLADGEKQQIYDLLKKGAVKENVAPNHTGKSSPYGSGYKPLVLEISKYMIEQGMEIQPLPKVQFIDNDEDNAQNILGNTAYYNPQSKAIVLYTLNRHPKDILRSFCHEMVHHEQNMKGTLGDIRTQNTTEDSHLDRIEREAYEKGNIMFRNWEDNYKKTWQSENPSVPSDYRVNRMNEDEREEENKGGEGNPGGDKYTIYCDMDGVLCDFDKRFMEFSNGIPPSEYESKFGKSAFWELISKKGVGFWSEMEWKVDEKDPEADEKDSKKTGGKTLWEYIEKYKPIILSAPSFEKSSKDGKEKWINSNLKNVGGIKLVPANEKQKFANPNAILIDDRTSNIQQWIDKGGIGILHTSADETIKQLKKYGL